MKKTAKKLIDFEINENECYIVTSHKATNTGHVQFLYNGKKKHIHRHMYEECFGEIKEGQVVKQSCGHKNCINPNHMYIAYQTDAFHKVNIGKRPIDFKINEDGCFVVTSHKPTDSGHIQFGKKKKYLHRHVYEQMFGDIEEGLVVRHKCDNPMCINPEHLIAGTQRDNIQDMMDRDRNKFYRIAKLNDEKVREIKIKLSNGEKPIDLASEYGVSEQTIVSIRRGKTWKHVVV
jgi:DNA-binding XRE family transcriptional regulator